MNAFAITFRPLGPPEGTAPPPPAEGLVVCGTRHSCLLTGAIGSSGALKVRNIAKHFEEVKDPNDTSENTDLVSANQLGE